MAKWWCTELQKRTVDRCLQLHGGYGYMLEYPIARAYTDARITTIYGGTTEIMKEIIGKSPRACKPDARRRAARCRTSIAARTIGGRHAQRRLGHGVGDRAALPVVVRRLRRTARRAFAMTAVGAPPR